MIYTGDCLKILPTLDAESVQCCVTSPPYWGLRDYGVDGQIGLEKTPEEYVAKLVAVFREVRRVLRDDGCLFLNLGDTYAAARSYQVPDNKYKDVGNKIGHEVPPGYKQKDLIGVPWRVAFALQADGWWLRQDIIWAKPNPMPESVTDRCTKSHEYIFLLTKSSRYFYDAEAVKEDSINTAEEQIAKRNKQPHKGQSDPGGMMETTAGFDNITKVYTTRNRRSVWTITTKPFSGAMLMADYVGGDGKPYKVSPDCPIHGRLANRVAKQKTFYDAQPNPDLSRNPDNGFDPGQEPLGDNGSTPLNSNDTQSFEGHNGHIPANITGNKTHGLTGTHSVDGQESGGESFFDTKNTHIPATPPGDNLDCFPPPCVGTAIDHNRQTSKMGLDPLTNRPCISSAENPSHIERTKVEHGKAGLDSRISENKTGADSVLSETEIFPLVQTHSRSVRKSLSPPYPKGNNAKCVCQVVNVDHFATFPPEIPEICIKAGTSEKGCCPECGSPWERVVNRVPATSKPCPKEQAAHEARGGTGTHIGTVGKSGSGRTDGYSKTVGWRPTCTHDHEPIPCTVLDPFSGSGTTGNVAERLGRKYIGIELNPAYSEMGEKRIDAARIPLNELWGVR